MQKTKILIVDDEAPIRLWLRQILEAKGMTIGEAANGTEALAELRREAWDAIITDVLMPDTDGIELLLRIRRDFPNLAVITMSGGGQLSSDFYLGIAKKLGTTTTLVKPFDAEELEAALALLLADRRP